MKSYIFILLAIVFADQNASAAKLEHKILCQMTSRQCVTWAAIELDKNAAYWRKTEHHGTTLATQTLTKKNYQTDTAFLAKIPKKVKSGKPCEKSLVLMEEDKKSFQFCTAQLPEVDQKQLRSLFE